MRHVDQDVCGAGGEGVAVVAGPLRHGQFGADTAFERDAVVTGFGMFGGEALAVAGVGVVERSGEQLHGAARGDDEHVEHVADAGARQMRVAEAHDRRVGAVIARTRVPALDVGVGGELHHAERDGRAG